MQSEAVRRRREKADASCFGQKVCTGWRAKEIVAYFGCNRRTERKRLQGALKRSRGCLIKFVCEELIESFRQRIVGLLAPGQRSETDHGWPAFCQFEQSAHSRVAPTREHHPCLFVIHRQR